MAEKVKDKIIRLERELTDAIRSELSLSEKVNVFYGELKKIRAQVTVYAIDNNLAYDEVSAINFLSEYSNNKYNLDDNQIKFDFRRKNEER